MMARYLSAGAKDTKGGQSTNRRELARDQHSCAGTRLRAHCTGEASTHGTHLDKKRGGPDNLARRHVLHHHRVVALAANGAQTRTVKPDGGP